MPRKDPEARKEYHRAYIAKRYKEDPEFREKMLARTRKNGDKYRNEGRKLLEDFKAEGCKLCGEKELCCLVAHHLDPELKKFSLGDAIRTKLSPAKISKELEKCVCLCANCHMKLHAGVIDEDLQ